jgi:aminoglycoside phosphotransferase (APT) family kinase protein
LREIDHGWDFKVLVVDAEWIVRIPRQAEAATKLGTEINLLPALAPSLPVEIPRFEQVSLDPPFVVYRLIEGEPLRDEDSDGVRGFLEALHAFDADGLDLPRPDLLAVWRERADEFKRVV